MTIDPNWHKSSYSSGDGGNCIEVADNASDAVLVRDTKDHGQGLITVSPSAWAAFVTEAKNRA